jgi:protein SDA1
MNMKQKQNQLNRQLQNFMYKMLSDSHTTAAKKSLDLMVALYVIQSALMPTVRSLIAY